MYGPGTCSISALGKKISSVIDDSERTHNLSGKRNEAFVFPRICSRIVSGRGRWGFLSEFDIREEVESVKCIPGMPDYGVFGSVMLDLGM